MLETRTTTRPAPGIAEPGPHRPSRRAERVVRAGFIPLMDASVLIAAAEFGFADREGIRLDLVRDVSWANIRDRLAFGQFDIAHMLSPMPVAGMLGLGSNPFAMVTPFALGLGGNAITVSRPLYRDMKSAADLTGRDGPAETGRALASIVAARREAGAPPLTFAMTYPFSSHNYELRYWLAAAGIHPDQDMRLVVVPPPLTADALSAGAIDGFCVGAPWNTIAVERGVGRIVATKAEIWRMSPEKVLCARADWAEANRETLSRMVVALDAAARWCDRPENSGELAALLGEPRYVGAPPEMIRRILEGRILLDADGTSKRIEDFFVFHRQAANLPRPDHALWLYSQMVRWGQTTLSEERQRAAAAAFRPDLYQAARLETLGMAPIGEAERGFFDGRVFDPAHIGDYVASFQIHSRTMLADRLVDTD